MTRYLIGERGPEFICMEIGMAQGPPKVTETRGFLPRVSSRTLAIACGIGVAVAIAVLVFVLS